MNGCHPSQIKRGNCICPYYDRGHCGHESDATNPATGQFICPIAAKALRYEQRGYDEPEVLDVQEDWNGFLRKV